MALFREGPENAGPLAFRWEGDSPEPHCFNLSGTDCFGQAMSKKVTLENGRVQPLWFGVDFSADFRGEFSGNLFLEIPGAGTVSVSICVEVDGEVLEDRGDNEPWRHSRLRWLDSVIAIDDGITAPYIPLQRKDNRLRGLANQVTLAETGLPAQLESRIAANMETVLRQGRPALAGGITFGEKGGCVKTENALRFTCEEDGVMRWESVWEFGGLSYCCHGSMEYDGYQEYQITVTAREESQTEGLTLEIPYCPDTAVYWMGLGQRGGLRSGELDWKWDVSLNQDTLWMGDVNASFMLRLKGLHYQKPHMLIYYHYHPLVLPVCWDNDGKGGVLVREESGNVKVEAYTGPAAFPPEKASPSPLTWP